MIGFRIFVIGLLLAGCTTPEHQVKEIDTTLETKEETNNGRIGLNDDKQVVIQNEVSAGDELKVQEMVNADLERDLEREHFVLKLCRRDLADQRLGGSGAAGDIPEIDNMKTPNEVKEEFGLNADGNLRVVRRELFVERLKSERKYETSLRTLMKVVAKHREKCEGQMAIARSKHGLAPERYKAEGYFTGSGIWVETRKGEQTLNDAFEIAALAKKRNKAATDDVPPSYYYGEGH